MPQPTDNVIAAAVLTLASAIQGWVSVSANRATRKSLSEQLKNGINSNIQRIERKVDDLGHEVGKLHTQVARLDERSKKEE